MTPGLKISNYSKADSFQYKETYTGEDQQTPNDGTNDHLVLLP